MSEVTKEDVKEVHKKIGEVHKRIDEGVKCNTEIQIDIAIIKTKLSSLVIPEAPERPCPFFNDHIDEHKKIKGIWQNSAIKTGIDIVKLAIVATVTWLLAANSKN